MPRINQSLEQFKASWNNHGIRTERGRTPNQLFTEGALRFHNSDQVAVNFFDNQSDMYGVDFDGVVIPANRVNLTDEQIEELKASIDALAESDDHGLDIYQHTVDFLEIESNL